MSGQNEHKILLIEGKQQEYPAVFLQLQRKGYDVELARNGMTAIQMMKGQRFVFAIVNSASLNSNGYRIVSSLKRVQPQLPVLLVVGEGRMKDAQTSSSADFVIEYPCTVQKIVNRIKTVLYEENDERTIRAGHICLDVEKRIVFVNHRAIKLTPRICSILELLIRNQDRIVKRIEIYKYAWKTDEPGDMRTLDVHIRWLREMIEENPARPVYLKTVRGEGYCLVTPNAIDLYKISKAAGTVGG